MTGALGISSSAGGRLLSLYNPSQDASLLLQSGGPAAGNAYVAYDVAGTHKAVAWKGLTQHTTALHYLSNW